MEKGYYKYISSERRQAADDFLRHYWENAESEPEHCPMWLEEKGLIRLLEELVNDC